MLSRAIDALSDNVLRIDAATPLSETLKRIRDKRASHVAVFSGRKCLGVSSFNDARLHAGITTTVDLIGQPFCPAVSDTTSFEELGRVFEDSRVEAQLILDDRGEFTGVVTRQSLLDALLKKCGQSRTPLQIDEERLKLSFEASQNGLWDWNIRTGEVFFSNPWCKNLGFEPSELKPDVDSWKQLVHPDDLPLAQQKFKQHFNGDNPVYECENRLRTKSGEYRWNLDRGSVVERDVRGNPLRMICVTSDITERKRAEALLAGEARILKIISTSLDCGLAELVKFVETFSDGMHCSILLMDEDGTHLRHGAAIGSPDSHNRAINDLKNGSIAVSSGSAAFLRQKVFVNDIANHPLWENFRNLGLKQGVRACWSTPIHSSSGKVLGTIVMCCNEPRTPNAIQKRLIERAVLLAAIVIERKNADDALRASETRSRTLLEDSPVCTKIIDLESRLQYMSAAGQKQLKIPDIQSSYGDTFPSELYPETWRAPVTKHLERAMAGEVTSLECPVLDTEGNKVWYDTTFVPARDKNGVVQYVIVTSVNITERKAIEDELSDIFEMSLDLICVADIDTATFVKVNPSFLRVLGYSEEELLGRTFLDFVHPEDIESTINVIERELKKGEKVMGFENRYRTKDGGYRWLAWTANPKPASGLAYSIAHDITESKIADEQVRKHRDELAHVARVSTMGEMATGIAHELNQPLAAIASYAFAAKNGLLQQGGSSQQELRELLDKLEGQAIRAGDIVRRLRDFVRKADSTRVRTDINQLVRDVVKFVEPDIQSAGATLTLICEDASSEILVDKIQIQQVLVNLIKNAVDAMEQTPVRQREVTVSTRIRKDNHVEVSVSDVGEGLPEDQLEQIFDTFFSTKREGMGMGLPISRSIVESHGGKLWSKANIGPGATFGFTIPREPDHQRDQNQTVFIVEDEAALRDAISLVIQTMGLSARCFSSAVEFLEFIEPNDIPEPVCIIIDVQMPWINGVEALEHLRLSGKKFAAIIISGNSTNELKQRAVELGAIAFLEKPFRPQELQEIIGRRLVENA